MELATHTAAIDHLDKAINALALLRDRITHDDQTPTARRAALAISNYGVTEAVRGFASASIADALTASADDDPTVERLNLLDRLGEVNRLGSSSDPIESSVATAVNITVARAIRRRLVDLERAAILADR